MQRPQSYCSQPGCTQRVARGACAQHAGDREHGRANVTVRRWYRTERWRQLRRVVLREAAYACATCGQVQIDLHVDHIHKHDGDRARFWDRANLQALCPSCHSAKTARGA